MTADRIDEALAEGEALANWTKHTGTGKPEGLADAQIVEAEWPFAATPGRYLHIVDDLAWDSDTFHYRPSLDPDGLPYVSAEGLEDWAEYVATNPNGGVFQYERKPRFSARHESWMDFSFVGGDDPLIEPAPDTHAIPGDPKHSLARVWRK